MTIWAIADLHLSFSTPEKNMKFFGPLWDGYEKKIAESWRAHIQPDDLVLLAGDHSWAMRLEEALVDLAWIDQLPGTKVMIRGNHDYWWSSNAKMAKAMPSTLHFIHNNAFLWNGVAIGGARLWDTPEYNFHSFIHFQENTRERKGEKPSIDEKEKIFVRELERLCLSLQQMDKTATRRLAMVHYPPIGADLAPSRASKILEEYDIEVCVFGHLHNVKAGTLRFGEARGVRYFLTSCDYLNFVPIKIN